jgi:hypothetical protein
MVNSWRDLYLPARPITVNRAASLQDFRDFLIPEWSGIGILHISRFN